jgi:hypothetical protein
MTRYYFDLRDHLGTTMDEEGMELNDLQRAQEEAARSLVDIARDAVAKHDGGATQGMAVECGTRTVPFCTSASGSKSIGCGSIEATALCGAEPMFTLVLIDACQGSAGGRSYVQDLGSSVSTTLSRAPGSGRAIENSQDKF